MEELLGKLLERDPTLIGKVLALIDLLAAHTQEKENE